MRFNIGSHVLSSFIMLFLVLYQECLILADIILRHFWRISLYMCIQTTNEDTSFFYSEQLHQHTYPYIHDSSKKLQITKKYGSNKIFFFNTLKEKITENVPLCFTVASCTPIHVLEVVRKRGYFMNVMRK